MTKQLFEQFILGMIFIILSPILIPILIGKYVRESAYEVEEER